MRDNLNVYRAPFARLRWRYGWYSLEIVCCPEKTERIAVGAEDFQLNDRNTTESLSIRNIKKAQERFLFREHTYFSRFSISTRETKTASSGAAPRNAKRWHILCKRFPPILLSHMRPEPASAELISLLQSRDRRLNDVYG